MSESELAINMASIVSVAVDQAITKLEQRPLRTHYSLDEAAFAMGVTAKTVLGEITRGNIKAVKVGKGFRINVEQLKKLGQ